MCITNGGHTQPTAFTKLRTVDVASLSALTVLYKGSFTFSRYTYTVYIADVDASESEGEDGEESEEQDLSDQFDDIYDYPNESGKSGGVDIEEQIDALATSSTDSPVQPVRCSKHVAAHCFESQPTAFMKISTVDISPWSALTVLYKGSLTSPKYFSSFGTVYTPVSSPDQMYSGDSI